MPSSLLVPLALLASVAALWGILFIAIPPWDQEFPLNDDWAFARGAFDFARGDGFHYLQWASMPQLGQWLWAWPFIQAFGESHAALRFSTVVLSLLGILAFFDLLRQAGLSPGRAAFVSACFALNPLYFVLSGTFLTDVPALAFSLVALALYGRAFALASTSDARPITFLALAGFVAVLGAITRQNAIAVPITVGLVLLRSPRLLLRPTWLLAIAIPAGAALAAHYWLKTRPDFLPLSSKEEIDLGRIVLLAFTIIHYMGLTALPVLLFDADWRFWKKPSAIAGFTVALLLMAGGALFCGLYKEGNPLRASWNDWEENPLRDWWNQCPSEGFWALFKENSTVMDRFPYLGNMLTPWGQFGPNDIVVGERPVMLGSPIRMVLSVLGCIAGAALLVRASGKLWRGAWKEPLTIFSVVHVPVLVLPFVFWDRYFIVLMPGALYLATHPRPEASSVPSRSRLPQRALGLAVLGIFGLFSLGLLHDWLAWNSARWAIGRRALENHIAANDIEGGFEWNGWYAPLPAFERVSEEQKGFMLWNTRCMYAHITGRYALSFSIPEGARAIDQEPYNLWLISGRRLFYLIESQGPDAKGS